MARQPTHKLDYELGPAALHPLTLRLRSPYLERAYDRHVAEAAVREGRTLTPALCVIIAATWLAWRLLITPADPAGRHWADILWGLGFAAMCSGFLMVRRPRSPRVVQTYLVGFSAVFCCLIIVLIATVPGNIANPVAGFGFMIQIFSIFMVGRLRYHLGVPIALLFAVAFLIVIPRAHGLSETHSSGDVESHGVPGEVHISDATADALAGSFSLRERGTIEVKGLGPMRTWFLGD
jgi:hypothetical protein